MRRTYILWHRFLPSGTKSVRMRWRNESEEAHPQYESLSEHNDDFSKSEQEQESRGKGRLEHTSKYSWFSAQNAVLDRGFSSGRSTFKSGVTVEL